jgi:hypothetical protein
MRKTFFNVLKRIWLLPNLAHELLHYIPAWYWGLNPRVDDGWSRMRHRRTTDGKNMAILLMPAFVGFLFLPLVWSMVVHKTMFHVAAAIFWVGWLGACSDDIYTAGYFLIFKKWHNRKDEQ